MTLSDSIHRIPTPRKENYKFIYIVFYVLGFGTLTHWFLSLSFESLRHSSFHITCICICICVFIFICIGMPIYTGVHIVFDLMCLCVYDQAGWASLLSQNVNHVWVLDSWFLSLLYVTCNLHSALSILHTPYHVCNPTSNVWNQCCRQESQGFCR